jgi:hypothetical protein
MLSISHHNRSLLDSLCLWSNWLSSLRQQTSQIIVKEAHDTLKWASPVYM